MKELAGEFAQAFNLRKGRTGSFWADRYHATMVEEGPCVWRCIKYIDLNMVRAGVVNHPREWKWCGYTELIGARKRNRLLDFEQLLESTGYATLKSFRESYIDSMGEAVQGVDNRQEPQWTESIAVGSEAFISKIEPTLYHRACVERIPVDDEKNQWILREKKAVYG